MKYILSIITTIFLISCSSPNSFTTNYSSDSTIVKIQDRSWQIQDTFKTVPINDTIIKIQPYYITLDTIIKTDTIKFRMSVPANTYTLSVNSKPDTSSIRIVKNIKTALIKEDKKVLSTLEYILIGLGILIVLFIIAVIGFRV